MAEEGQLTATEPAVLRELVAGSNEVVVAAYAAYAVDSDITELMDTLKKVAQTTIALVLGADEARLRTFFPNALL